MPARAGEALQYHTNQQVVHGDLKPRHVVHGPERGLARPISSRALGWAVSWSRTKVAKGTIGMIGLLPSRRSWGRAAAAGSTVAVLACLAPVAAASPQSLASSLQRVPVQSIAVPKSSFTALSPHQIASLREEISRSDHGRISILVVSPRSDSALGNLADPVFGDLPAGTLIAVAEDPHNSNTTNWWVGASWQSSDAAQSQLNNVIQAYHKGQGSFYDDLRLEIRSFARGDAAAGHPRLSSSGNSASPPASGFTPSAGFTPAAESGGSSSSFPIGLVVSGAIVLFLFLLFGGRYLRKVARVSHRHREESADAHAQAQKDFIKLGEEIAALDIDSSLANASPAGKDEYRHALGCYETAEKRLKQADDPYQFQKAVWAIKAGRRHVHAANELFNPPSGGSKDVDKLTQLVDRHRSGVLSDAEFAEQESKLID